jgi:ATP-binding cassette subfamily B protein
LDEVSSSLDVVNEYQLIKNIRKAFPYSTIINISHRASTLQHADRACIIQSGKLVDIGKVNELKGRSSYFSKMFNEESMKRDQL